MKVSSVLLPVRAKMIDPLSGIEVIRETGQVQEYLGGRPVGKPFTMPTYTAEEVEHARRLGLLSSGNETFARAEFHSPDTRSLAAHNARPGESEGDAATRLANAAARFDVAPGSNRAESRVNADFIPYLSGNG